MSANAGVLNIQLKVHDDGSVVVQRFGKNVDDVGKKAERSFSGASVSVGSFNKQIAMVGAGMAAVGIGLLVAKMADLSAQSIKAASDYEEAHSKFNVVFAGLRQQAEGWVTVLTDGFAMSETEAVRYLSSLQDLLVPMGMARDKAADMSFAMTKLAADLGSFNNVKTADVINDMQSAMVGEYDTMKKYGVVLNATIVQQKAMAMGFGKTADEIDASEKALAAYQLILESSSAAIGDMERTGDSYANTTKRMDAAWEDFAKTLGTRFLPAATSAKRILAETFEYWEKFLRADSIDEKIKKIDDQITKVKANGPGRVFQGSQNIDLTEDAYKKWVREHNGRLPNNDEKTMIRAQAGASINAASGHEIQNLEAEKKALLLQKEKESAEEKKLKDAADKSAKEKQAADAAAKRQAESAEQAKLAGKERERAEKQAAADLKRAQEEKIKTVAEFGTEYKRITLSSYDFERMELDAIAAKYSAVVEDKGQVEEWLAARKEQIRLKETEDNERIIQKEADDRKQALEDERQAAEERLRSSTYWSDGAIRAMDDYAAHASDAAAGIEPLFSNAFSGMEDALVSFVMTGKGSFGDLVDSMIADIVRLAVQQSITAPLASALASGMSSIFGGFGGSDGYSTGTGLDASYSDSALYSAKGHAFSGSGVYPFARGGVFTNRVVSSPTLFRFGAGGAFGVMGEAGDEAVVPLTRTSSGELGVKTSGSSAPVINVTINNQASGATGRVESMSTRSDGGMDLTVIIEQIDGAIASGIGTGRSATSRALEGTYGLNRAYGAMR